jgi:hypothetical protein
MAQIIGVATNLLWVFPVALLSFFLIEKTIGNRVPAKVEIEGLDIPEMGVLGYVTEDPVVVQTAGQEHISTYGPGVPRALKNGTKTADSQVPSLKD